jgi:glycosyltransferase involved in cell wall biosynthesis
MLRVLYIGDPMGIHDPKWISYFSTKGLVEAHMLTYPKEDSRIKEADRKVLEDEMKIRLHPPIKYYSVLKPHQTVSASRHLNRIIKENRIDIVHALFAAPSAVWALHVDVPFIITARGSDVLRVIPGLLEQKGWHAGADRILYNLFGKAFHRAAAITGTSNRQLERIWQMFGTRNMHLVRTGVDVEAIRNADMAHLPAELVGREFIFLPRFTEPIYNTLLQAEALKRVPEVDRHGLEVVLVGGHAPDYEREVIGTMADAGWKVTLLRDLSQAQMWAAFRKARLSMMTPVSDGTPNSALEAMAAGCPNILGAFEYDLDLFGPEFCLRMSTWEPDELASLVTHALSTDLSAMTDRAYRNILERGNRKVEMEKLRALYTRLATGR